MSKRLIYLFALVCIINVIVSGLVVAYHFSRKADCSDYGTEIPINKLSLIDNNGNKRIKVDLKDEKFVLAFVDSAGRDKLLISLIDNGVNLSILNGNGIPLSCLYFDGSSTSGVALNYLNGNRAVNISVDQDVPKVVFYSNSGAKSFRIESDKLAQTRIEINDENGISRYIASYSRQAGGFISLVDSSGVPRFLLGQSGDSAGFALYHKNQQKGIYADIANDGSSKIGLLDKLNSNHIKAESSLNLAGIAINELSKKSHGCLLSLTEGNPRIGLFRGDGITIQAGIDVNDGPFFAMQNGNEIWSIPEK